MLSNTTAQAVPFPARHVLSRPRLLRKLGRPAALFVIRGSSGSGTSTLLADWARRQQGTVLWLELGLEPGGALLAPAPFWHAVLQGIPDAAGATPRAEPEDAAEPQGPRERVARIQAALRALDQPLVLALDSAEALAPETVEELVAVLAVVPALVVGVATFQRGPFESLAVRLKVDTVVVDSAELAFTAAETAALLAAAGLPDDDQTVGLVRAAAGGHPRATRAVLSAPSWPERPSAEELTRYLLVISDWTDKAVLPREADEGPLLALARHTSIVEQLPLGLAEALIEALIEAPTAATIAAGLAVTAAETPDTQQVADTQPARAGALPHGADAAALLDRAESLGLGNWSGDASTRVFQFTPLVRGILRRELTARGDAEAAGRLAIGWLLANDGIEAAFLLAAQTGEYELASEAAARRFDRLLSDRRGEVRAVLAPVPLQTMRQYPLLAMLLAVSYNEVARLRHRALEYFTLAILGAKALRPGRSVTETIVLDTVVSAALRMTAQSGRAARAAVSALDGFRSLGDEEREQLGLMGTTVTTQSGLSLLYGGEPDAALAAFRLCPAPLHSPHSLHVLAAQAGTHALIGEMPEASILVAEGRARSWPRGWADGSVGALYQLAQALLAIEALEFEAAQAHISAVDEHIGTIEHWGLFAQAQARLDLYSGSVVGLDRLRLARHRRRGRTDLDDRGRAELDIAASTLHLAAGNLHAAESELPSAQRPGPAVLAARARLELVRDAPELALALLAEAAPLPMTRRLRAELAALNCAVRLRLGRRDEARDALESLAVALDGSGLMTPLALLPVEDLRDMRALAATGSSELALRVLGQTVPPVLRRVRAPSLSERERVVLRELVLTTSIPAIADTLFVSVNTVKSQLRSLYRKLGVSSREDALVVAASLSLLAPSPPRSAGAR